MQNPAVSARITSRVASFSTGFFRIDLADGFGYVFSASGLDIRSGPLEGKKAFPGSVVGEQVSADLFFICVHLER